ncbi:hypothetical protein FHL15_005303 [Xylaria flabelliformis]|uniref:Uncharacterized protein n=1 Tax=Xylaria flabelliformis TaxID=2512241 RepID=A0A553I158_9PEZI|nr:hypothetical protein FHL15_005303 [Xylaria flabelliformis]
MMLKCASWTTLLTLPTLRLDGPACRGVVEMGKMGNMEMEISATPAKDPGRLVSAHWKSPGKASSIHMKASLSLSAVRCRVQQTAKASTQESRLQSDTSLSEAQPYNAQ